MVDEMVDFYNMLVDDVPTIQLYNIKAYEVDNIIEQIDAVLSAIEIEVAAFDKLGGRYLEDWIVSTYFPNAVADSDSNGINPFAALFKSGNETAVTTTAATTTRYATINQSSRANLNHTESTMIELKSTVTALDPSRTSSDRVELILTRSSEPVQIESGTPTPYLGPLYLIFLIGYMS